MVKTKDIVKIRVKAAVKEKNVHNLYNVKVKKKEYAVYSLITEKKLHVIGPAGVSIYVLLNKKHIEISGASGDEFVFKSKNCKETIERWENVLEAIKIAVDIAERERKDLR